MVLDETTPRPETPTLVEKEWGREYILADKPNYGCKILVVEAGQRTSLQRHFKRDETWFFLSGTAWVTIEGREFTATAEDLVHVPVGLLHRIEGITEVRLVEAVPRYVPGDIERIEDDYGRAGGK